MFTSYCDVYIPYCHLIKDFVDIENILMLYKFTNIISVIFVTHYKTYQPHVNNNILYVIKYKCNITLSLRG